jgi:hypothetical protein
VPLAPIHDIGSKKQRPRSAQIRCDGVDFISGVHALEQAVCAAPARVARDNQDVVPFDGRLALNTQQSWVQIEDEIAALVHDGLENPDPEPNGLVDDRRLGNCADLVRREHFRQF